jgi:hypothetical protein
MRDELSADELADEPLLLALPPVATGLRVLVLETALAAAGVALLEDDPCVYACECDACAVGWLMMPRAFCLEGYWIQGVEDGAAREG